MNIFEIFLYGLISGITEILPISSSGHQAVFRKIFGDSMHFGIYNVFVHIGILIALLYSCKPLLNRMRRMRRSSAANDRRIVNDATPVFIIASVLLMIFCPVDFGLLWVALFFVINGIILLLPTFIATGNKDARSMSVLDSILIGLAGAVSIFPGLSRVGSMTTMVSVRGGDRYHGIIWALAISVPSMAVLIVSDIYFAVANGVVFYFAQIFHYFLALFGAFLGACIAVRALRRLSKMIGVSFLSYYCWGMALLTFVLFLMV